MNKIKHLCKCIIPCCSNDDVPVSRSNTAAAQKQAVLYMPFDYSMAWVLTWVPYLLYIFMHKSMAVRIIFALFQPSQGLYNLIVYLLPTANGAKRSGNLNWYQSFAKSWISRGPRRAGTLGNISNRRLRTGKPKPFLAGQSCPESIPQEETTRIKLTQGENKEEEEKCELRDHMKKILRVWSRVHQYS
jgi:hypothetical protein